MTLHIDSVEAFWLAINGLTLGLTLFALWDAWKVRAVVRKMNGRAREIVAAGNTRREGLRVVVQIMLLSVVVPGLFIDRPTPINAPVVALILVPVILFTNSIGDILERRALVGLVQTDLADSRSRSLDRIEEALAENTRITQEGSDHAIAAYEEANAVNEKIAAHGETLVLQGEAQAEDRQLGADTNETAHRIDDRLP